MQQLQNLRRGSLKLPTCICKTPRVSALFNSLPQMFRDALNMPFARSDPQPIKSLGLGPRNVHLNLFSWCFKYTLTFGGPSACFASLRSNRTKAAVLSSGYSWGSSLKICLIGVPVVAPQKQIGLGTMRLQVGPCPCSVG